MDDNEEQRINVTGHGASREEAENGPGVWTPPDWYPGESSQEGRYPEQKYHRRVGIRDRNIPPLVGSWKGVNRGVHTYRALYLGLTTKPSTRGQRAEGFLVPVRMSLPRGPIMWPLGDVHVAAIHLPHHTSPCKGAFIHPGLPFVISSR